MKKNNETHDSKKYLKKVEKYMEFLKLNIKHFKEKPKPKPEDYILFNNCKL